MSESAFVRLGPSSAALSQQLAAAAPGDYPDDIEIECAQVPHAFDVGSKVWLWLGSDNNKGQPTNWTQGIRALGYCKEKVALGSGQYRIVLENLFMLPRSVEKLELLQTSPETYAQSLSGAAIIGLNNYSSQVVQLLSEKEFATIAAIIVDLIPQIGKDIFSAVPNATKVHLIARPKSPAPKTSKSPTSQASALPDDDPILGSVRKLLDEDQFGGVLLTGVPGTGKTWYAREIAKKLTDGDASRIREVQFHPSYQYEDFVEGYIPDENSSFRLVDKHLLQMIDRAAKSDESHVIVMDEFSRTDPARVMGEALTYMEGSMRGVSFHLPSGRETRIPANLIFLATMNPDDRSVDELDDAMDRRWGKVEMEPDPEKVREFLSSNSASDTLTKPVMDLFLALQEKMAIGHAFFRNVKDRDSLVRLWDNQLKHILRKRFRFDQTTLGETDELWGQCLAAIDTPQNSSEPEEDVPVAAAS